MKKFSSLSVHERPREKLVKRGPSVLSDLELIALLLGSGNRQHNVLELGERVLKVLERNNGEISVEDLTKIPGIGKAKATLLSASFEFSKRRIRPLGTKIRCASDVYPLIRHIAHKKQEHFLSISLNGAHELIEIRIITIGLVNAAHVHPREVFADAITDRACAIIVAHNHPSDVLHPSNEDKEVTKRLKSSGELLGIPLIDHVIIGTQTYFSFQEKGLL
jgi:DNA repair protein RadC